MKISALLVLANQKQQVLPISGPDELDARLCKIEYSMIPEAKLQDIAESQRS